MLLRPRLAGMKEANWENRKQEVTELVHTKEKSMEKRKIKDSI